MRLITVQKSKIIILMLFHILSCAWTEKNYCERYYEDKQSASVDECGGYLYLQDSMNQNGKTVSPDAVTIRALYRCSLYFKMKKECGSKSEYLPYTGSKYK